MKVRIINKHNRLPALVEDRVARALVVFGTHEYEDFEPSKPVIKPKRTYKRRDMRAE